ncbi:MAG: hypothetical protein PGN29_19065 [Gordonia paraffinivorans]
MSGISQWATVCVASVAVLVNIGTSYLVLRSANNRARDERRRSEIDQEMVRLADLLAAAGTFRDAAYGYAFRCALAAKRDDNLDALGGAAGIIPYRETTLNPARAAVQHAAVVGTFALKGGDEVGKAIANLVEVIDEWHDLMKLNPLEAYDELTDCSTRIAVAIAALLRESVDMYGAKERP